MWKRIFAAALTGLVGTLGVSTAASAHAALLETSPEDGAALDAAPETVTFTFNEDLDPDNSQVGASGPDGDLDLAEPSVDGNTLTQPMTYTAPGEYTVSYRVLSEDGHNVSGTIAFEAESIPEALRADGGEDTEPTAEQSETAEGPDGEASPSEESASDSEGGNGMKNGLLALLGVVVVVAIVIAFVKIVGGRKNDGGGDSGSEDSP
ncbi:copper resistance CopC family protein [Salininema proteolyticum]|uniref:Copper resistance protein CopC n=1 Tax=Salininema proteolyticum TaxID=1607685 RepID=A0ABV8TTA1_9ACTN